MLVPPYTPKSLFDWDMFQSTVKMRAGDHYVLQWETIHNPDGYTVHMAENVEKKAQCDAAPITYGQVHCTGAPSLYEVTCIRINLRFVNACN